jgi:tetratricopeptide (TPR) repeat protein
MTEALQNALAHHQAGRLREAEAIYQRILEGDPLHAEALHFMGVLATQTGRPQLGGELIGRAIRLRPSESNWHFNLGAIHQAQDRPERAVACFQEAARLQPQFVAAHVNLGAALHALRRHREAILSFRAALAIQPDSAQTHFALGTALHDTEDWEAAMVAYREALRWKNDYAEVMVNLADALKSQDQLDEAAEWCERAIRLRPDLAEAHNNLGTIFARQRRLDEIEACYRHALRLKPDYVEAQRNLGALLHNQNRLDEAEACYRRAVELEPAVAASQAALGAVLERQGKLHEAAAWCRRALGTDPTRAEAHGTLGAIWQQYGKFDEALAAYDRAIDLQPDQAEFRFLRSTIRLMRGDFAHGWQEFEARLQTKYARPAHPQPRWNGAPLQGERIVVHAEWGLGDTLQLVRYLPLIQARGGDVVLEVQPSLMPLLRESGFQQVFAWNDPSVPECQWHVPIFSLPGIFKTTLNTIPATVPYLQANAEHVARWAERLRGNAELKVGIHWHSERKALATGPRSMSLAEFEPLARVAGVTLISLQKDAPADELRAFGERLSLVDFGPELDASGGAFMDTAAIMKNLDLVITCDTSTAHVAGGLGVPVWVAIPLGGEFRWLLERSDSPWYPTMRLFRQARAADWSDAFAQMRDELVRLVERRRRST